MYVCWSAKGGAGTTVVAASLALLLAQSRPTVLVDLDGDAGTVLGMPESSGPGIAEWLASPTADGAALDRLTLPTHDSMRVVPRGTAELSADPARWAALVATLASSGESVVVDAGAAPPHPALAARATASILVTRACFVALRRCVQLEARPTSVVLVREPGRALGARDVELAVGAPVVAVVPYDPEVWRSVDAGLLTARLPRSLRRLQACAA